MQCAQEHWNSYDVFKNVTQMTTYRNKLLMNRTQRNKTSQQYANRVKKQDVLPHAASTANNQFKQKAMEGETLRHTYALLFKY